jgi:DNA repair protein SbcD/Mre11
MRVLHTADWHLGAVLKQVQRLPDQLQRVEEVLSICDEREVDLLMVVGDVIDETSPSRMTPLMRRLGDPLRPRLERGMTAVFLAGNHDRPWIFPLLQVAGELYGGEFDASRLHFCSQPELRIVASSRGERLRLMLLPYPWPWNYNLEAVQGADAADRRGLIRLAVQERIKAMEEEVRTGEQLPTIVAGHLLITGVSTNRHELTEAEDVSLPQVALPNYPYVALGHVHQPLALGRPEVRYSGSIERMDFGEIGEEKSVVLVDIGAGGLMSEPEVIPLHPAELYEIKWHPGDSIEEKAAVVPVGSICKLMINLDRGMSPQTVQATARTLIGRRLLWPPEIRWAGSEAGGSSGSPALDQMDWRQRVREYLLAEVAENDPRRERVVAAVEELITEETSAAG